MHVLEPDSVLPGHDSPRLLDLLPVGVALLAADGTAVWINRALADLLRCPAEPSRGRSLESLGWTLAGSTPGEALAGLRSAPGRPDPSGALLRLRHQEGHELFVRAGVNVVRGADPQVKYMVTINDVTDEHRAAEGIRAERDQYRILVDHVGDIVFVHHGLEIIWASPSVRHVLGREPRDLVGRTLADLVPEDDLATLPELPDRQGSVSHRVRLRHADGTLRWFQTTISVRRPFGRPPIIYACLRDIHDQIRTERALADRERLLRLAFDASPDGWAIVTAERGAGGDITDLRYASVNETALRQTGRTTSELVGRSVLDVMRGEAAQLVRRAIQEVLRTGQLRRLSIPEAPGHPFVYEGFVAPIDSDNVLMSWRDVTERVRSEQLVQHAYEEAADVRATLQSALDAMSDCFTVHTLERDQGGRITGLRVLRANHAAAAVLGCEPADLPGKEIHELFPDVVTSGLWDRIGAAVATGSPQHHRVQVFDGDGRWTGAWDSAVSPVGSERVTITWRDASAEEAVVRQLARTRDEAVHSATHDPLTGLPNRILLREHLHEALAGCPPQQRIGLVFVDLDRFKEINDRFGHAVGDAVLKATAHRLGGMVRHGDLAARFAGDEFILVLTALTPDWSSEQFFARATALLAEPIVADGVEIRLSASLGAVLADPCATGVDVDGLIKLADAEMYRAKAAARQR